MPLKFALFCEALVAPVSATVTCAVAAQVAVAVVVQVVGGA